MIKGLKELLTKHGEHALTEEEFEKELDKILPETHMPKSVYNELNEKYKALASEKDGYLKQIEEATKNKTSIEDLNKQIEALNAKHKEELDKINAQVALDKKNAYIDAELTKAHGKNLKAIKALLETDKVTLSDNGGYLGLQEQLESVKKDNPFLFDNQDEPKIVQGGASPAPIEKPDEYEAKIAKAMGL